MEHLSWAASSEAMCTYSMSSSEVMGQQVSPGSHSAVQAKDMHNTLPARGICEDHTHSSSLHTAFNEAPTCIEWDHPHDSSHIKERKGSSIAADKNASLGMDRLDPHADAQNLQQLEEFVHDLVPALHMVNKSTHNMNIAYRQEAFKLTADALLSRRATGRAWSDALSKRVSIFCSKPQEENEGMKSLELLHFAMACPDYIMDPPAECASSCCIKTPVHSSEATNSCELSDRDLSSLHREYSTASALPSSDHSSMVDSTSDQLILRDDIDALNYAQSGVSLPFMGILSGSEAHISSANSSGELLSMCKQGENEQLKRESHHELHEVINASHAMIRSCCKEQNEDAKKSSVSCINPHEEHVLLHNPSNDTPAIVKNYHHISKHVHDFELSHAGKGIKIPHPVHHGAACRSADVAHSDQTFSQFPCADAHHGNALYKVACSVSDVAHNGIHVAHDLPFEKADAAPRNDGTATASAKAKHFEVALGSAVVEAGDMIGLQGMQMDDKAILDDVAGGHGAEVEAKVEADVEGGLRLGMTWQGSHMKQYKTNDDVTDEVAKGQMGADVGGGLKWQQPLTWQDRMYELAASDDVASDVMYGAKLADAGVEGAIRMGSHGGNEKMREMMYRVAAYQPLDWESIMEEVVVHGRRQRRNVKISKEPQSVAARRRRERISERIRILQRLVPGTSKLDTASMLDEAIHYLKFLQLQVQALRRIDKFLTSRQLPLYMATTDRGPSQGVPPIAIPVPVHFNHPFQI